MAATFLDLAGAAFLGFLAIILGFLAVVLGFLAAVLVFLTAGDLDFFSPLAWAW